MDIRHCQYFVEIVKSDFNLSNAAKKLHISQPALSQFIKFFEETESIYLFERYKGRLQGLTPTGELFYENVQQLLAQYDSMLTSIREDAHQLKGKVRIGIPPLILSVVFPDVIAQLIINNPNIEFQIIEKGAYQLSQMFIRDELDLAILLNPTYINPQLIDEYVLSEDELSAFFNQNHQLASKEKLCWQDFNNKLLAIFDPSFMIHHKLKQCFETHDITPKRNIMSSSWDFLLTMTQQSDFITILPSPIKKVYSNDNIIERSIIDPIYWTVMLCRPKKKRYHQVNQFVFDYIIAYFSNRKKN